MVAGGVAILAGQTAVTIVGAFLAAIVLSGGVIEVLLEDTDGGADSARRVKAVSRITALPSALAGVGLLALRGGASPGFALAAGIAAAAVPSVIALLFTRRFRLTLLLALLSGICAVIGYGFA